MSREDQLRHLESLEAELAETCAKAREIRHDRDMTAAWLDGHDVGYDVGYDAGYVMGRENRDPMLSDATPAGAVMAARSGVTTGRDPQPAPPEEYWDYL